MDYQKRRRFVFGVFLFLLILLYLFQNFSTTIRVWGVIFGLFVFYVFDYLFDIDFEFIHYLLIFIILVSGILLAPLYFLSQSYDKILHFISPILACFLIFHVVNRKNLSFQWKVLVTFMFLVSFLTIHEVGEYIFDRLWDMKLQGVYLWEFGSFEKLNLILSQHEDTMLDLIFGMFGGLVFVLGKSLTYFFKRK